MPIKCKNKQKKVKKSLLKYNITQAVKTQEMYQRKKWMRIGTNNFKTDLAKFESRKILGCNKNINLNDYK